MPDMPKGWADLIEGLTMLAPYQNNESSPLHCEHDKLTVMADPTNVPDDEIVRLLDLGFTPDMGELTFISYRFGSA